MSRPRGRSRQFAVQAIYQWQITGREVTDVTHQFLVEQDSARFEVGYFGDLVHGVVRYVAQLDEWLGPCLDRSIESVDPVERAILRLGAYELGYHPEVPYKVVINEAVELAKVFGATDGHKYVNGVLDNLSRTLRETEIHS